MKRGLHDQTITEYMMSVQIKPYLHFTLKKQITITICYTHSQLHAHIHSLGWVQAVYEFLNFAPNA